MGTCVRLTGRVPDNPQVESTLTVTLPERCENGKKYNCKNEKMLLHKENIIA